MKPKIPFIIYLLAILGIFFISTNNCRKQGETSNNGQTVLPEKLIITSDIILDEMDAITGWRVNSGSALELNTSAVHSGSASLKVTSALGVGAFINKAFDWNLSDEEGNSINLWVYPHSTPLTTFPGMYLRASKEESLTNYFIMYINITTLQKNKWSLLRRITWQPSEFSEWTIGGGTPSWNDINYFRISVIPIAEQQSICSFDLIKSKGKGNQQLL